MEVRNVRPSHIAKALGVAESEVFTIARNLHEWFKLPFTVTSKGKTREYDPPTVIGKRHLARLARFISKELPVHPCAHGSVKKRSPFTSASQHLGRRIIVKRDVENCFPSLSPQRFESELIALGFLHDVAFLLTGLLLYRGRLPQGSPASNAALNLFFFRTDEVIRKAAAEFGGRYTRFADDFNISIEDKNCVGAIADLLEKAILDCGLMVNGKKRRKEGLQLLHDERTVNGIVTNSPTHTRLPSKVSIRLVEKAEKLLIAAKSAYPGSLSGLANRRRRLEGSLNYASMAGRSPARAMRRVLSLADDAIQSRLSKVGISYASSWWYKNQNCDAAEILAARWFAALEKMPGSKS